MNRLAERLARYLVPGLLLLSGGCSHQAVLKDDSLALQQRQVELTAVPFFPQKAYQCAPAALATLLNYRGIETTPDEIRPYVYLPGRKGSIAPEVLAYARKQGLLVYPLKGKLNALLQEVAAGNPVLVMQNLSFDWFPQWHFAVVVGYDLDKREMILRSADVERWVTSFNTFDNTWRRSQRWAYTITQPSNLPANAEPLPVIRVALDLEEVGQAEAATRVYQAALQAWPEQQTVLFAAGNHFYGQGEFHQALAMYHRLTKLYPEDANGWNNLAYSYLQLNCRTRALQAINRGLELKPDDPNLQSSRQEITDHSLPAGCLLE